VNFCGRKVICYLRRGVNDKPNATRTVCLSLAVQVDAALVKDLFCTTYMTLALKKFQSVHARFLIDLEKWNIVPPKPFVTNFYPDVRATRFQ